jgi:hypothetical protein
MRSRVLLPVVAAALAAVVSLAACKRDPADAHPVGHQADRVWNLPPVGPAVKVTLDGKSTEVTLSSLAAGASDGAPGSVSFAQLWKAAWPGEDPASLHFDFVGSDGFHPASKEPCARLLTGRELSSARLETTTHNLLLDDGLKLPGCYRVRAVVSVAGTR